MTKFLKIASRAPLNQIPDFERWRALAKRISSHKPDYLVLLARKMTRLWQYMRDIDTKSFLSDIPTISHFALDYLDPEKIRGKNIAVIDDAINIGSTMSHVCGKLDTYGAASIKCFVLARKRSFNPENLGRFKNDIYVEKGDEPLSEEQYHATSAQLNKCLLMAGRPLELEFPVYSLDLEKEQEDFLTNLKDNEEGRWQWLTYVDADIAGMQRLSLTREDGKGNLIKYRFYLDRHRDRVYCVPMPFDISDEVIRRFEGRADLYARSKTLMDMYKGNLQNYGVKQISLVDEDTYLLFGSDFEEKWLDNEYSIEGKNIPSDFLENALSASQIFKSNMDGFGFLSSLRLTFVKLFQELGQAIGEDRQEPADTEFLRALPAYIREKLKEDNYLRLQLGLTFPEIINLLTKYCTGANKISPQKLRNEVSRLLDEHIDQGFVVPILDLAGRRAFRKGEAAPQDRALLFALVGHGATFGDNLLEKLDKLKPGQRKKCLEFIQAMETRD